MSNQKSFGPVPIRPTTCRAGLLPQLELIDCADQFASMGFSFRDVSSYETEAHSVVYEPPAELEEWDPDRIEELLRAQEASAIRASLLPELGLNYIDTTSAEMDFEAMLGYHRLGDSHVIDVAPDRAALSAQNGCTFIRPQSPSLSLQSRAVAESLEAALLKLQKLLQELGAQSGRCVSDTNSTVQS